ncbi:MAG: pyridoxal phosphate-dependent decarboxylase family protein [Mycobacteriales bacterium]
MNLEPALNPRPHWAELLGDVTRYAIDFLEHLPERDVSGPVDADGLRAALGGPLPAVGGEPRTVVRQLAAAVAPGLVSSTSGRYFGYVFGGALPVAVAADWLTTVWDQCALLYAASPAAAVTEEVCGQWLVDLLGLPSHASVGFVTGCQAANFTALAAARHHVLADHGWDVEARGLCGAPVPRVLVSASCHASVGRALRLLGLGGQIRQVPCEPSGRMRLDAFRAALGDTRGPLIACLEVGDTDAGQIDPIAPVADLVHRYGGWLHLDAAFGMWAAASPRYRDLVAGLDRADSWATDAHKLLNVPYDSGIVFCAHPDAHGAALRIGAEYLGRDGGERDPVDWVPEVSRRARAFVLWATLRALGRSGVAAIVEHACEHASRLGALLAAADGVEIRNEVVLNQVLVSFRDPYGRDDDLHTRRVVELFQADGRCWGSGTTWQGRAALRLSVCNWSTTDDDIDTCVASVLTAHHRAALAGDRVLL